MEIIRDGYTGYNIWGVAVTEVEVDILTGEMRTVRVDLVQVMIILMMIMMMMLMMIIMIMRMMIMIITMMMMMMMMTWCRTPGSPPRPWWTSARWRAPSSWAWGCGPVSRSSTTRTPGPSSP